MERSIQQELFYLKNFFRFSNCNDYNWDSYFEDVFENYSEDYFILLIESLIKDNLINEYDLALELPYSKIGEKTIEHLKDHVDWDEASSESKLSEDFILKYKDNIDFEILKYNSNIPEDLKTLIEVI